MTAETAMVKYCCLFRQCYVEVINKLLVLGKGVVDTNLFSDGFLGRYFFVSTLHHDKNISLHDAAIYIPNNHFMVFDLTAIKYIPT